MTDSELDENCDTSNFQLESNIEVHEQNLVYLIERDLNFDVLVKISKKEKTQADLQLKNRKRTAKRAFEVNMKRKYKKHKKYVMDPLTQRYKCNKCEKDYAEKRRLIEHFQRVHEGLTLKCKHCPKTFTSNCGLFEHTKSVHEGVTFKCDQCTKTFNFKNGLRIHKQSHHLKRHVRSVHEGVTYQCEQCPKTYAYKEGLTGHTQAVHEGVTYPCDQCDYLATSPKKTKRQDTSSQMCASSALAGQSARLTSAKLRERNSTGGSPALLLEGTPPK